MIRPFRAGDAAPAVAVLRESAPDWTSSPASLLHRLAAHPPRARQAAWAAEEEGEVVGVARARLRWEVSARPVGWLWVAVRPAARGRGSGAALFSVAERHLAEAGADVLESFAYEESGRTFLEARGFRRTGTEHLLTLDVVRADPSAPARLRPEREREGFSVVSLAEALDRPRDVHAVYAAAHADVPDSFGVDDLRYEEWRRECLDDPDLAREGSAVVLHGERPVALAFVMADGEGRAANDLTGTLPEYRRRGLARLAKLATIRWAAEAGVERIVTGSDEANAGMRSLNASLGYRPLATGTLYLREGLS